MDKSKIRKSIAKAIKLMAADCNQEIKDIENLIEAWHITLEDLTDQEIANGLKKALSSNNRFMISSGEFRELAITGEGHSGIEAEAREAWNLVVSNLNYYAHPVFKNSVISEAIRNMGGWQSLCSMLTKDIPFREKDFINHYRTYKIRNEDYAQNVLRYGEGDDLTFIGFDNDDDVMGIVKALEESIKIENKFFKMISEGQK
jgi:hypothetical protein